MKTDSNLEGKKLFYNFEVPTYVVVYYLLAILYIHQRESYKIGLLEEEEAEKTNPYFIFVLAIKIYYLNFPLYLVEMTTHMRYIQRNGYLWYDI